MSDQLRTVLEHSRALGLLGPGPVERHIAHARGFAGGVASPPGRFLDLGSGGGVPGLVLTWVWPDAVAVLVESSQRRCEVLRQAVVALSLQERVTIEHMRAEELGRREDARGTADVVVARAFGRPAVTAECGAPLLRPGGWLIVSEPPASSGAAASRPEGATDGGSLVRWPAEGLAQLGLAVGPSWQTPFHYQALVQREPCPPRYPRRVGTVTKRPLF